MSSMEYTRALLSQINLKDVGIFITVMILLIATTTAIRKSAEYITKKFPEKRMGILEWVPFINFLIYFIGTFFTLYVIFQPQYEAFMATVAGLLVGLGFCARDILASILAGIVLLFDKPFQIGDQVKFESNEGEIVNIGLRSVKLRTLDKSIITIPNNRFMSDVVISGNAGHIEMATTVTVYISPDNNLLEVQRLLHDLAKHDPYIDNSKKVLVTIKEILTGSGSVALCSETTCVLKDARKESEFRTHFLMNVNNHLKQRKIREGADNPLN